MLTVGIPREIKQIEKRVGLTPEGVDELRRQGIPVLVESEAGLGSGFRDEDYTASGARIVPDASTLYETADLIQKVKEPLILEYSKLHKGQILFCFLHLASPEHRVLLQALLESQVTAMGYETVEMNGRVPLLAPMSEIAGALSVSYAAFFRNQKLIEEGKIIYPANFYEMLEAIAGLYPRFPPEANIGNVLIFGGGVAGQKALEFALGMKGKITVIESNPSKRESIKEKWKKESERLTVIAPEELWDSQLIDADILIGCVHQAGKRAAQVINPDTLAKTSAKKKKIIMDVSIDQGGNFPEAHETNYKNPLYVDSFGNLRFAVANIPSLCGRGASEVLTKSSLPYTLAMAKNFEKALKDFPELARAINVRTGQVVHPAIIEAHKQ